MEIMNNQRTEIERAWKAELPRMTPVRTNTIKALVENSTKELIKACQ